VHLARLLPAIDVRGLDDAVGRRAGVLLREARQIDVIDAALVLLARDGDDIFTSDASDLVALAGAAGLHVDLVPV
jgi:hypothetical protein